MESELNSKLKKVVGLASELAKESEGSGNQKLCAVAIKNGKIVNIGFNKNKTHTIQALYAKKAGLPEKVFLHAEIDVITRTNDIDTLVVVRVKKDGTFGVSKPCPVCSKAIEQKKIKKVVYFDGEKFTSERYVQ